MGRSEPAVGADRRVLHPEEVRTLQTRRAGATAVATLRAALVRQEHEADRVVVTARAEAW